MIAFSASRTKMCGIPGIDVRKLRHAFLLAGDGMLTATLYNFSSAFLALLTYLYEIPAGACLGYLILQTFCLILQMSSRNPVFTRSLLGVCNEGEVPCHPSSHL
jgi:hypothetical protein